MRHTGILHRDVKPSNCFLDREGVAKIGDFGLSISTGARGDASLTVQGLLLGTQAFASPEQLRGDELHARSDLYSVGATLLFLLTGEVFNPGNMGTTRFVAMMTGLNLMVGLYFGLLDYVPLIFLFVPFITYGALPSLLMALIIHRGLILTVFGTVVADAKGQRASRLRCVWRGLIAWSPFVLGSLVASALMPLIGVTATMISVLIGIVALTTWSLLRRDRSLQDRLASTWLVPQ